MSPLGPRGTHCTECLAAHSLSTSQHCQATEHTTPSCVTLRARFRPVSHTCCRCLLATLGAWPNTQNTRARQDRSNTPTETASTSIRHKRFPIRFSLQLAAPRLREHAKLTANENSAKHLKIQEASAPCRTFLAKNIQHELATGTQHLPSPADRLTSRQFLLV